MATPVIGIDLGTTNTVVAAVRGGRATAIGDDAGHTLIPSVVSFHPNGSIMVGREARERRLVDANNTIYSIKRLIGRSWDTEEVRRARTRFAFQMREGPGQATLVVGRGETYTLPEISAFVLRRAKQIAEASLGEPVERAVITVPANFNDLQRAATKVAGRVAGLDVLRILNEPTAAALAYGYGKTRSERLAVYDFGGGTFDVTLLDLSDNVFEVLATAGNTFLGGDDVDLLIAERMANDFLARHRYDPRTNPQAFERLRVAAEQLKQRLSFEQEASILLEDIAHGAGGKALSLDFRLSRSELEHLLTPIVDRTFDVCQEALSISRLKPADFDQILLVGGSTRIPLVKKRVEQFFQREVKASITPDEVVALGAAIQANALTGGERRRGTVPPPPAAARRPPASTVALPPARPRAETIPGVAPQDAPAFAAQRRPEAAPSQKLIQEEETVRGRVGPDVARPRSRTGIGLGPESLPLVHPPQEEPTVRQRVEPRDESVAFALSENDLEYVAEPRKGPPPPPVSAPAASPYDQEQIITKVGDIPDMGDDEPTRVGRFGQDAPRPAAAALAPPLPPPPIAAAAPAQARAAQPSPRTTQPLAPAPFNPIGPPGFGVIDEQHLPPLPVPVAIPAVTAAIPAATLAMPTTAAIKAERAPGVFASATLPLEPEAQAPRAPLLVDVTPLTLVVETVRGYCDAIIVRNTPVPCEQTREFVTAADGQTSVRVRVAQGESKRFAENTHLGEVELTNLEAAPRGSTQISVTFALDANGMLNVSARESKTGRATRANLKLLGLPETQDVSAMVLRQQQKLA